MNTSRFSNDGHAIYASLTTGVRVRVSPFMSYDSAIRVFYGAGLAAGEVPQEGDHRHTVGDYEGTVKHYAVRSQADPGWPNAQPPHDVRTVLDRDVDNLLDLLATC